MLSLFPPVYKREKDRKSTEALKNQKNKKNFGWEEQELTV